MLNLDGFSIRTKIYESDRTIVYWGIGESNRQTVFLKVLNRDYPTIQEIERYEGEYNITQYLDIPGVPKVYGLKKYKNTLVMILEDFGGESLSYLLEQKNFSIQEFLQIAIKITEILGQIHNKNVIHKDINPSNIVFNPKSKELKIIDFGQGTQLNRETPIVKDIKSIEGTLPYISPEQTGRMNRFLDYRTDFYSLGVTFYELLTNQLPFTSYDILELVHCHLAKQPPLPSLINTQIPPALDDIIMKLMAKNPEERYQSTQGIKEDLKTCLEQLNRKGNIEKFILGKKDKSYNFQLPKKLYGREKEVQKILDSFNRAVSSQREMMLISGAPGIGKTVLIQEVYKNYWQKRGYFITGKFGQYEGNIPYLGLVKAFQQLIKQLLKENTTQLQLWKTNLVSALGINGKVMIDVIPEVELIIGKQPSLIEMEGIEAQNRFTLTFQKFIKVFTISSYPLTIFLDDLQWADRASLKLLQVLMNEKAAGLFVIATYRDQEISLGQDLITNLADIEKKGGKLEQIYLKPLSLEKIAELIADTFNCLSLNATDLAKLVLSKTGGNPLFIHQFIKSLYLEKFIYFNVQNLRWEWKIEKINKQQFTDNVLEFMAEQIQRLPENTQEILKLASCLGDPFDLTVLSENKESYISDMSESLQVAIAEGFIRPLIKDTDLQFNCNSYSPTVYQFVHDKIRRAAYSLLGEEEKISTHYKLGKILLEQISKEALDEKIFVIINQLNYGIKLIDTQAEKDQLAKLNMLACYKAKELAAFEEALKYATIGLSLLHENPWQRQYEMSLEFHEIGAEVALLCGNFNLMNQWIEEVIHYGKNILDKIKVFLVKIQFFTSQNQFLDAILCCKIIFKELGVKFPDNPTLEDIHQSVGEINALMGLRSIDELFQLPVMLDTEKRNIMELAKRIIPACYLSHSPLFPLVSCLQVKLSIEYGNSPVSATGYADYGRVLINILKDIKQGSDFGKLAYRLASSSKNKSICAVTFVPVGLYLHHHKFHLKETLTILEEGYQAAFDIGKLEYVGHNSHGYAVNAFWCGQSLTELEPKIRVDCQIGREYNLLTTVNYCQLIWETILFLQGNPQKIEISFEEKSLEQNLIAQAQATNDITCLFYFYLHKAMVRFLLGNPTDARADIAKAREYIVGGLATICEAGLYFYDSLIALAISGEAAAQIPENQAQLQLWAEYAPMNYLHKWQLVEAERYRVLGDKLQALELYDLAIAGAKENGYLPEEALAKELAAKFYLDWGKETIARAYMVEARYAYLRWGATAKIAQLEREYPQLLDSLGGAKSPCSTVSSNDSSNHPSVNLDITTMIKSSQAIASEIVLENLLQTLITILLQTSGAQSGCLLLYSESATEEDFTIVIAGSADGVSPVPAGKWCLPQSILHHVVRTQESVVLENACQEGDFVTDPYIQSAKLVSLVCYPLLHQGQLVGIVYLENNLIVGAFTAERIEFLQLISEQAAIAITNAQLYAKIREREQTLKQFLEAIPVGIGILDKNGRPYYVNQTGKVLLGKGLAPEATADEIAEIYQNYKAGTNQLYPNQQLPIIKALNGQVCHVDDIEIHQGDKIIPVEAWGTPIYGESGDVDYAIAVFQDISQRRQAEKILTDYSHTLKKQVAERTAELIQANQKLARLAVFDGLTQIPNRRRFDEYIATEWQRHRREKQCLALILIDIDYFKRYNDHYGHQGGDDCLIRVAKIIAKIPQRPGDLVARYGGEEFAAILPDTDTPGALVVAQSMIEAITTQAIPHAQSEISPYVTLSLGVASLIPTASTKPEDLIARADEALYQAKRQGRNCAIPFEDSRP